MTRGEYQLKPEQPFTLGMELAGEVVEAASESAFAVGDRVRGGAKTGAMAGFAAVPGKSLRPTTDEIAFGTAAAMGAAYNTAYVALV